MRSRLSNGVENKWVKEDNEDVTKEILASDEIDTSQMEKSSSRGCTIEPSQPNTPIDSEHIQNFLAQDVFLSHSGKQKNFVRQLHRDLTNLGVSCFFDQNPDSLPKGEYFPSRILEAAKTCKVAVLLLSAEFLESKWPMLELSAFVEAKVATNRNLKILPLFFMIPPVALKKFTTDNEKWKQLENSEDSRVQWQKALKAIRQINGLTFSEGGDEVKFRDEIVKEIWRILPTPSPRYYVHRMQGEARMCQELVNLFDRVRPNRKGIRIAGLYGIAGRGKTTLGKAYCNFKLGNFEGKVCHLEFSRGNSIERIKHALHYLTHCPQSHLQTLTCQDQAQVELHRRVQGRRVLLVLDDVTEESIDEVMYYLRAELGEKSCILLSARSVDVMVKHLMIDKESCMRVPGLKEEEAIAILLDRVFPEESKLGAEDRGFALMCAKRCSFEEVGRTGGMFHPLALKAFGGHLSSKCGSDFSAWVNKTREGLVNRSGYGLDDLLALLGTAFYSMLLEYRTIFMLLTLYMPPNMSPHIVNEWLAMILNREIAFIEKAVEDLCKKSFIEECAPEIRIHDLYIEFAQSKANEMGRWLWWKGDSPCMRGLVSQDNAGFELAKLEHCMYRRPSQIPFHHRQNLLVLQLIDVENMNKVDLGGLGRLRSITLHRCKDLQSVQGIEKLQQLAWLQISGVNEKFAFPKLGSLQGLQHLEINNPGSQVVNQLGDLRGCVFLRDISVRCRSLLEFPRLSGLRYLEKVEFGVCDRAKGPLDCRGCEELQSVVLDSCSQMVASPLLGGCKKVSKIVLWECDAVTACLDIGVPSAVRTLELSVSSEAASLPRSMEFCCRLNNLHLWNMGNLEKLPSFRLLSNLTVLKLGKCGIREPPDLTCCVLLEDVYFYTLNKLERFPNFSSLRKLKKLSLYDCWSVEDPPDISGCNELQVFHLVYNDNMEGLPNMGEFPQLEEIKLSWPCEDNITCDINVDWHRDEENATDYRFVHGYFDNELANYTNVDEHSENAVIGNQTNVGQHCKDAVTYIRGKWGQTLRNVKWRCREIWSVIKLSRKGGSSAAKHHSDRCVHDINMSLDDAYMSAQSAPPYEDLQTCLERFKDESFQNLNEISVPAALAEWEWVKGKTMLVKKYVRVGKLRYSLTAPYELHEPRK